MPEPDYLMLSVEADGLSRNLVRADMTNGDDRKEHAARAADCLARIAKAMGFALVPMKAAADILDIIAEGITDGIDLDSTTPDVARGVYRALVKAGVLA